MLLIDEVRDALDDVVSFEAAVVANRRPDGKLESSTLAKVMSHLGRDILTVAGLSADSTPSLAWTTPS